METIPYQQPDSKQVVRVEIAYDERPGAAPQRFTIEELVQGKTLYLWEWLSPEEFDKRCE